jgi:hypothetical protein
LLGFDLPGTHVYDEAREARLGERDVWEVKGQASYAFTVDGFALTTAMDVTLYFDRTTLEVLEILSSSTSTGREEGELSSQGELRVVDFQPNMRVAPELLAFPPRGAR